jgi:O-acetyl-ADP-ribose deacetylase (regulator of RNase III)
MNDCIKIIEGNIFDSKCQTVVNTINCVGVMGKGLALEFKKRYPDMFLKYKEHCSNGLIDVGKLWLYKSDNHWILNFPTKTTWKLPSKYEYVELGLQKFVDTYKEKGITSIAFPMLGCTNGKLDESKVLDIMMYYLMKCDIPIEIYRYKK